MRFSWEESRIGAQGDPVRVWVWSGRGTWLFWGLHIFCYVDGEAAIAAREGGREKNKIGAPRKIGELQGLASVFQVPVSCWLGCTLKTLGLCETLWHLGDLHLPARFPSSSIACLGSSYYCSLWQGSFVSEYRAGSLLPLGLSHFVCKIREAG